jgi:hypothetical protein
MDDEAAMARAGVVVASVLLVVGGITLIAAFLFVGRVNFRWLLSTLVRWMVVAGIMVVPSALLFGPTGGFHHMIGFGPFPFSYMVWDGEEPSSRPFQIVHGVEVGFDPLRFGIYLAVWTVIVALVVRGVRPIRVESASVMGYAAADENEIPTSRFS